MLNGKPYQCVSFNSFQLCGCGHDYELFTDEEIDALFGSLPKNTIIRTWSNYAFSHKTDMLIRLAEKHKIKLILSLGDGRSSCGDVDGDPRGDNSGKVAEWYKSGYRKVYLPHVIEMTSRDKRAEVMKEKFDIYIGMGAGAVFVWNLAKEGRGCGHTFNQQDPLYSTVVNYPANKR